MEFNLRLRKAGFRILLVPGIVSEYYARSDLASFMRHNWTNGVWAVLPFLYSDVIPVSPRHLVPLAFVLGLISSSIAAVFLPYWGPLAFMVVWGTYVTANLVASLDVAFREKDLRFSLVMPFVFSSLHVGYGLGSVWGALKSLAVVLTRHFERTFRPRSVS